MKDVLTARLTEAQQQQANLLQQRARLTQLLDQATGQLNASQGRIEELTALIALCPAEDAEKVGGTD